MSTQKPTTAAENSTAGVVVITIAVLIALGGVFGFALLSEQPNTIRFAVLFGCIDVGCAIGWFRPHGKRFVAYCKASYEELRRVVWPTRKETVNTTGIVCAFIVAVAFFLFIVDNIVDFALRLIM